MEIIREWEAVAIGVAALFVWWRGWIAIKLSCWDLLAPMAVIAVMATFLPTHELWGWTSWNGLLLAWILIHLKYPIRFGSVRGVLRGIANIGLSITLFYFFGVLMVHLKNFTT